MTDAPGAAPQPSRPGSPDVSDRGSVAPRREPPGPSRLVRRAIAGAVVVAVLVAVPILGKVGVDAALRGGGPGVASSNADPTLPGYQAIVVASPTVLALDVAADGRLVAAALVGGSARQGGGGVLVLPGGLRVDPDPTSPTLGDIFVDGGPTAVASSVAKVLRVDPGPVVRLDAAAWRDTIGAGTSLTVDNPAPLLDEVGATVFPAGRLTLTADRVADYVHQRTAGEDDLEALYRAELVWTSWLERGGSGGSVLGDVVGGLAGVPVTVLVVPAALTEVDGRRTYDTVPTEVDAAVALVVPFPAPPESGGRPRVRLLDGTGDATRSLRIAEDVVPLGVSIVVFGNADRFDHIIDVVEYHRPGAEASASRIARRLGVDAVSFVDLPDSAIDVTIVVGSAHVFDPEVPNAAIAR